MRPTWPRSAANTPSWQVTDDSTRIVVLTAANGTLSCAVFSAHSSGLTARIVKYDANSAAKNISSLESQMMVPDADHARSVVVPVQAGGRDRSLLSPRGHYVRTAGRGHPDPLGFGVIQGVDTVLLTASAILPLHASD